MPSPFPRKVVLGFSVLAIFLATGVATGCAPPPRTTAAIPSVSPLPIENPWDPLPSAGQSDFPSWIQEFFPLPAGRPYGNPQISQDSFTGQWDIAAAGTGEVSRYSTQLRYAQWREVSRETVAGTTTIKLESPDGLTELTLTSTVVGAMERLKIVAERKQKAGA